MMKRYRAAYRVANTVVLVGDTIKFVGFALAGVIVLMTLLAVSDSNSGGLGAPMFLLGVLVGAVLGLMFWVGGVIVSAQGQILRAALDTAVNSSPFLDDVQRATVMSIRDGDDTHEDEAAVESQVGSATPSIIVSRAVLLSLWRAHFA